MNIDDIGWRAPLDLFAPLADEAHAVLLHGGEKSASRWSILAAFPREIITTVARRTRVNESLTRQEPLAAMRALLAQRRRATATDAPFLSGLIGFAGYEFGACLEPAAEGPPSPFRAPDLFFGAYDAVILCDRKHRRAFVAHRDREACERLLEAVRRPAQEDAQALGALRLDVEAGDEAQHEARVAAAVERIGAGDFFQANLARWVTVEQAGPIDAYRVFRRLSAGDAPYGAYLRLPHGAIVSASPERFFCAREGADARLDFVAEPIKGTRRRGATPAEDDALAEELLASAKDRAENVMIADLLRNDLSKICDDGAVREVEICALRSFSAVHHLVSVIAGRARAGVTAVDAFAALFPSGSITGAPKIEAMRAIAALEGSGRGPYCGAIGYFDDGGGADFSVAIRTMIIEEHRAHVAAGGGVTLRSDPHAEFDETRVKMQALLEALGVLASA